MGLTPQQAKVLHTISSFATVHDRSPSYDELRSALGLASKSSAFRLVRQLAERGAIEFEPKRKHSIRVLGELEGLAKRSTADLQALRSRIDAILRGRAQ